MMKKPLLLAGILLLGLVIMGCMGPQYQPCCIYANATNETNPICDGGLDPETGYPLVWELTSNGCDEEAWACEVFVEDSEGNQVFVWKGDTIDSGETFEWFGTDEFELDSLTQNFEFRFSELDGDGDKSFILAPHPPHPPKVPHIVKLNKKLHGNIIDLSDPGIISYKKKKLRGGREKIVIIREAEHDQK